MRGPPEGRPRTDTAGRPFSGSPGGMSYQAIISDVSRITLGPMVEVNETFFM